MRYIVIEKRRYGCIDFKAYDTAGSGSAGIIRI